MGLGSFLFGAACVAHDIISPEQRFKRKVADDSYRRSQSAFQYGK